MPNANAVEITGWTADNESVSAIVMMRTNETVEECFNRAIAEEGIVEVGDFREVRY